VFAQQAKTFNHFKNTKEKLLKTNAAIWFNKMCRTQQLCPKYVQIKVSGNNHRSQQTKQHAIKHRINQKIKFLYKKNQHLNKKLYSLHLEGAHNWRQFWAHILNDINENLSEITQEIYKRLNNKLDNLRPNNNKLHTTRPHIANTTDNKTSKTGNLPILPKNPKSYGHQPQQGRDYSTGTGIPVQLGNNT
jgi:hypothetical protein